MRIAVVNNFFPPRVGGSAHIADTLARHYADAGHEVLVIAAAYRGAPAEETHRNLRIVRLPSWTLPQTKMSFNFDITFALRWGNRKRVFRLLDEFQPDVIHQHGQFFDLTWQSGWWARRRGIPTMLTLHTRLQSPMKASAAVFRLLDATVVKPIMNYLKPATMVAIDAVFDEYIRARYKVGDDRIEYSSIGVEMHRFDGLRPEVERKRVKGCFGLTDGPLIVSLGHVIPVRDRVPLVEALPAVLAKYPDTQVLVVGDVYYRKFLDRAAELGVDKALVCTGALPKADIPDVLAAADMEIHDVQGFGIGISSLEAMAAGTPTVMAERPDYFPHATFIDGEQVLIVSPGDPDALAQAIMRLIEDPTLSEHIGSAGRSFVNEHFDMPKVCEHNLDLLKRIAN